MMNLRWMLSERNEKSAWVRIKSTIWSLQWKIVCMMFWMSRRKWQDDNSDLVDKKEKVFVELKFYVCQLFFNSRVRFRSYCFLSFKHWRRRTWVKCIRRFTFLFFQDMHSCVHKYNHKIIYIEDNLKSFMTSWMTWLLIRIVRLTIIDVNFEMMIVVHLWDPGLVVFTPD